jgi:hypothetical protein
VPKHSPLEKTIFVPLSRGVDPRTPSTVTRT